MSNVRNTMAATPHFLYWSNLKEEAEKINETCVANGDFDPLLTFFKTRAPHSPLVHSSEMRDDDESTHREIGLLRDELNRLKTAISEATTPMAALATSMARLELEPEAIADPDGESEQARFYRLKFLESEKGRLESEKGRLESEKGRLEEKKGRLEDKKAAWARTLLDHMALTLKQAENVDLKLGALAMLSQATYISEAETTALGNQSITERADCKRKRDQIESEMIADNIQPIQPDKYRVGLLQNAQPFQAYTRQGLDNVDPSMHSNLGSAVTTLLQKLFAESYFVKRKQHDNKAATYDLFLAKTTRILEEVTGEIMDCNAKHQKSMEALKKAIKEVKLSEDKAICVSLEKLGVWLDKMLNSSKKAKAAGEDKFEIESPPQHWSTEHKEMVQSLQEKCNLATKEALGQAKNEWMALMGKVTTTMPGPTSGEVDGVQRIWGLLLRLMAECVKPGTILGKDGSKRSTPSKTTVRTERYIARSNHRAGRKTDLSIWHPNRLVTHIEDDSMELVAEMKPGQRPGQTAEEMVNEELNQGISCSSKFLAQAINIGPGAPAHCAFMVGSPVFIQLWQLTLVNPGTPESDLILHRGDMLPLVSPENFDKFYESDSDGRSQEHIKSIQRLRELLYPEGKHWCDSYGTSYAIKAIVKVMSSPRQDLVGIQLKVLEEHMVLGYGTFGVVVTSTGSSKVVKLGVTGREAHLKNESSVLRKLSISKHLPELLDIGKVDLKIGGVACPVPAISLSPRGVSPYCVTPELAPWLIARDLLAAAKHLHLNKFVHNDINDTNIVVVDGRHAVLIDLGCARPVMSVQDSFLGTPNFVHKDVHMSKDSWLCSEQHDFVSIALTSCVLAKNGQRPWNSIHGKDLDGTSVKARDKKAQAMLAFVLHYSEEGIDGANLHSPPAGTGIEVETADGMDAEDFHLLKKSFESSVFMKKCVCNKITCMTGNCGCTTRGYCTDLCKYRDRRVKKATPVSDNGNDGVSFAKVLLLTDNH